jgi:hypothetical protein
MRLMVGFLVLNDPLVDIVAATAERWIEESERKAAPRIQMPEALGRRCVSSASGAGAETLTLTLRVRLRKDGPAVHSRRSDLI